MTENQSKEATQSLVVSKTTTQSSSTLEDWKAFTTSIPDDWPSSTRTLTAAGEEAHHAATDGQRGLTTRGKSPQLSLSPSRTIETSRLTSRGLSPLAHFEVSLVHYWQVWREEQATPSLNLDFGSFCELSWVPIVGALDATGNYLVVGQGFRSVCWVDESSHYPNRSLIQSP